jgi:transposase
LPALWFVLLRTLLRTIYDGFCARSGRHDPVWGARVPVFLRAGAVDFRKGPDGLVSLVRDAGADPFNGALYVFRSKRADRIKIVWFDGSGLCLFAKRLEHSHFVWPSAGSFEIRLSHAQLMALVEGLDWKRVRPVEVQAPQSAG